MPVVVWICDDDGLRNAVETDRRTKLGGEEFRAEAKTLDEVLDGVLGRAARTAAALSESSSPAERRFVRHWAIGHAVIESGVRAHPSLADESGTRLWRAMRSKLHCGAHSDGSQSSEWDILQDVRGRRSGAPPPRRESRRRGDDFDRHVWLAEQDFDDAASTFGGSVRNVWQMFDRPSLRPLIVRTAFLEWLRTLQVDARRHILQPPCFAEAVKTLGRRWPDRGALRPSHYSGRELKDAIAFVLASHADAGSDPSVS